MAKALMGHRPMNDQRMMLETLELRRRIRDLEFLVDRLQRDNDQLRRQREKDQLHEDLRRPDAVGAGVPTIAG